MTIRIWLAAASLLVASCGGGDGAPPASQGPSVARQWDEDALAAVRIDLPRPPVHARNLYYLSAAMWDAWVTYDAAGDAVIAPQAKLLGRPDSEREAAVSYAAYRVLSDLYSLSVNATASQGTFDQRMAALGLDASVTTTEGDAPAAVGNRVAAAVLAFAADDGANEAGNYADSSYTPVNDPLIVKQAGTTMNDPNRWQPLALDFQVSQNGIPIPGKVQVFTGSQWNDVKPFALTRATADDVYIDPGPPPHLGDPEFTDGIVQLLQFAQQLDADDATTIDISPAAWGNNPLGTNDGHGYALNPVTGEPYPTQPVKRSDFARVLAEFWADGPTSETPPGHWNVIANYASDQIAQKRIGGAGAIIGDLEWDVKLYLALNGALHDAAIECWGVKRKYDSVRPISQVRYLGGLGELPQVPGLIETITTQSSAPGERHEALADYVGETALKVWPGQPQDPKTQDGGSRWIRAVEWVPFQRATFVTPPFAAYFSGHSTFSRSAAEVLTGFTGSAYFPRGLGEFTAPKDHFLQFEIGPSSDVTLQWATYFDAADQAGLSRIYGGIHTRIDDFTGRRVGAQVGQRAWAKAQAYYTGSISR